MIRSVEDAWRWYDSVGKLTTMMDRIARLYWDTEHEEKTLGETLYKDDRLRGYESAAIRDMVETIRTDLDDLAVLLLFSVFEASVRDHAQAELERELLAAPPRHPVLRKAVSDAGDAIQNGSFGRLTEAYKSRDADLKTQVDQVRQFRNWVAHGRRGDATNNIDPDSAFNRLRRFLELLDRDDTSLGGAS